MGSMARKILMRIRIVAALALVSADSAYTEEDFQEVPGDPSNGYARLGEAAFWAVLAMQLVAAICKLAHYCPAAKQPPRQKQDDLLEPGRSSPCQSIGEGGHASFVRKESLGSQITVISVSSNTQVASPFAAMALLGAFAIFGITVMDRGSFVGDPLHAWNLASVPGNVTVFATTAAAATGAHCLSINASQTAEECAVDVEVNLLECERDHSLFGESSHCGYACSFSLPPNDCDTKAYGSSDKRDCFHATLRAVQTHHSAAMNLFHGALGDAIIPVYFYLSGNLFRMFYAFMELMLQKEKHSRESLFEDFLCDALCSGFMLFATRLSISGDCLQYTGRVDLYTFLNVRGPTFDFVFTVGFPVILVAYLVGQAGTPCVITFGRLPLYVVGTGLALLFWSISDQGLSVNLKHTEAGTIAVIFALVGALCCCVVGFCSDAKARGGHCRQRRRDDGDGLSGLTEVWIAQR